MDKNWVIAGKSDGTIPVVGQEYEIRDSRRGTYRGAILEIHDDFATVKVTKGEPHFVSKSAKMAYGGFVSIRAGLCYLIEILAETK